MANLIERVPPHNEEAEQAVLASMMADREVASALVGLLRPEHFYRTAHGTIFEAMARLHHSRTPIDIISIREALGARNQLEEVGGYDYILDLCRSVPTTAHADYYASVIKDKAALRSIIRAASLIRDGAFGDQATATAALTDALGLLMKVDAGKAVEEDSSLYQILVDNYHDIEARQEARERGEPLDVIESGFYDLDKVMSIGPGDLCVIAGRPAMGKSAFGFNYGKNVAQKGKLVEMFTLEMSKRQMARRVMAGASGVEVYRQSQGFVAAGEWEFLSKALEAHVDLPIFLCDRSKITVTEMKGICRKREATERKKMGLVIVDYLTLVDAGSDKLSETEAAGRISRDLKRMAEELDCAVIALSQLNRSVEARQDKRPVLSDLRQSGAIEQDAAVVLMLYRDEYYNPETEDKGIAEVIIAKNRYGDTGKARLKFIPAKTEFFSLDEQHTPTYGG